MSPRIHSGRILASSMTISVHKTSLAKVILKLVLKGTFEGVLKRGKVFLLTIGAVLLTVKLLCLQSLKALVRRTFPL